MSEVVELVEQRFGHHPGRLDPGNLPATRRALASPRMRSAKRPGGQEFRSLREYRPGDDPRRIAWRITARQGKPVLKEMEQENRGRVAILLSTTLAGVAPRERRAAMEAAVQ